MKCHYIVLLMMMTASSLSGCQNNQQVITTPHRLIDPIDQADAAAIAAEKECDARLLSGELTTHVEAQECTNAKIIEAFKQIDYPYMDLIELYTTKATKVAKRIDKNEITEAQSQIELSKIFQDIGTEVTKRNIAVEKAEADRAQKYATDRIREEEAQRERIKKDQLNADKAKCDSYDIKRGTDAFSSCLIQLDQARRQQQMFDAQQEQQQQMLDAQQQQAAQAQRAANAAAALGYLNSHPVFTPQQPYMVPVNRPINTNCTGAGNSLNCTSY